VTEVDKSVVGIQKAIVEDQENGVVVAMRAAELDVVVVKNVRVVVHK